MWDCYEVGCRVDHETFDAEDACAECAECAECQRREA
jgi:hypothetical protein